MRRDFGGVDANQGKPWDPTEPDDAVRGNIWAGPTIMAASFCPFILFYCTT